MEIPMGMNMSVPGAAVALDAQERNEISDIFAAITLEAGPAVMAVYAGNCKFRVKADSSPVCEADERAEAIILAGLSRRLPGIAIVAEEQAARGETPPTGSRFILVDPLDGTREFMSRNGEFTLNIGLIDNGVPVAGAVYAPTMSRLWFGGHDAFVCEAVSGTTGCTRAAQRVRARRAPAAGLIALASRSHADAQTEAFLATLPIGERVCRGSSLKFCVLAEGQADVYPRFGTTMEWDTAAGEAILRAAGGMVEAFDGAQFCYGKREAHYTNGGFIAWGDPRWAGRRAHADRCS